MNTKVLNLVLLFAFLLLFSGCASKVRPTDVCKYPIPISELGSGSDFDAVEFFDLAIEVAKEHKFAPPMKYDHGTGLLVFGHEDVETMPGLKMVTYMWVDSQVADMVENVCVNIQLLDVKASSLDPVTAGRVIEEFEDDLKQAYQDKIENNKRIMEKYNVN